MTKITLRFSIVAIFIVVICQSCSRDNKLILNETFDKNTRGWIEESSDFHSLYIDNGLYYIESKDTSSSSVRSSTGSLDKSYLFDLPDKYQIESKLKFVENDLDGTYCGLLLYGASFEYSFNIYKSGIVEILEYDYNSKLEYILLSDTSSYEFEGELTMTIIIDSTDFRFFIEDYEIGSSEFSVKSWQELRLFTSKQSKITVDYITIKGINQ